MPHVSRRKLKKKELDKIYERLSMVFDTVGKNKKSRLVLDEFLTLTEKIMLAKRLAIIFMLNEGISIHYIAETLIVSPSTVERISLKHQFGEYSYISKVTKNSKQEIWDTIRPLFMGILMPKGSKGRWKWFDEIDKRYYR